MGTRNDLSNEIEKQNLQRQQNITLGMRDINRTFGQFDDNYYNNIRKTNLNSLMPQFQGQLLNARRGAAYNLAGRGLYNSSVARQAGNQLEQQAGLGRILVNNQANQAALQARQNVEREKSNLTNQLVSSQDPTVAAQQAVTSAATIGAPSLIAPLGDLFQNFSNAYLARQTGLANNPPGQQYSGRSLIPNNYNVR